ncbi:hypothetical protein NP493_1046g00055 [Ridgeia piscesae]|uniref:Uncharacterized protein n=1 Tax=Ridgeia piscesae TaxID=27915 RepID=A0AAD9KI49_RIDPI|nr:hypothetical protein NP493_1046g00055 [Ridgeia piscesae]
MTSHQENITTVELSSGDDDDELVPKASSKRQRYKVETDRATASAATSRSYRNFTKSLSCTQQPPFTPSTPGFTTQMVVLERNSKLYTSHRQSNALPHLLEIESDCNWQNGRYKILSDIARLADSTSGYPQPVAFYVDQFYVRILEKPDQMTNIPPHLQKTLKTKQMYAVHVQITEASDDKRYNSIASKAAEEPPTFSSHCGDTDCGKMVNCESGFGAVLKSPYASRRSAQVEEARQALEQARKALTTELEKVKREREESLEPTSAVGMNVKEEADETTAPPLDDAVKVEGSSLLKSSLLRTVPTLVPAPHVRSPRQPVVPVAVVPNVAHSMQFNTRMADMTCPGGYDGCDDPMTEVAYDASCHDELDAAALSSIDDLLMTDDSSSLENTNGTLEDSSSGISSSVKVSQGQS